MCRETLKLAQWESKRYKIAPQKRNIPESGRGRFGVSAVVNVMFNPPKPLETGSEATSGHGASSVRVRKAELQW